MQTRDPARARGRIALAANLIRSHAPCAAGTVLVGVGAPEIDAALPGGGLGPGLHEIAGPAGDAARAGFAALLGARRPGPVLWCRSQQAESGEPYGVGLGVFGLPADRLILVEAARPGDLLWAMEEGARTPGLAAVVGEGSAPDLTASRRLQLATEAARGMVLLLPVEARASCAYSGAVLPPLAAATRWLVTSRPSRSEAGGPGRPCWSLELRRCRGGGRPQSWIVEWEDARLSLSVTPAAADRAAPAGIAATG
jgi:protein ImuA